VPEPISVPVNGHPLAGDLTLPDQAVGIVLFAHGSGSSRHSPRNQYVAAALNGRRLGTLLIDLLTADEEAVDEFTRELRFDIPLLADRLGACLAWLSGDARSAGLPLGLFGASTGAAAALICAARQPERVSAVVSRGGRPDLAGEALAAVQAPTLLIVGGHDEVVLDLNRQARAKLRCPSDLTIVAGARHLFEEPGALERVAELAGDWLTTHLG
jgi:putative phosphoribosyl transferase